MASRAAWNQPFRLFLPGRFRERVEDDMWGEFEEECKGRGVVVYLE